jgi:hypothetical protein
MAVSKQWAMIRSWLRKTYNKQVHEFFKDLPPELDPDNSSGRTTTKAVCLIGANDSQGIAELKMRNFDMLREQAGMKWQPVHDFELLPEVTVQCQPQVQLWFEEKLSVAKSHNRRQIRSRVSIRIKEDWNSESDANPMALRIKNKFANPIFHFERGKQTYSYNDKKKGYLFIVNVPSESEAKRVIESTLDLVNETPDWKILRKSGFVEEPIVESKRVLGETVRIQPLRETTVYFRYAIAKIWPVTRDIPLVDTSQTYWNAIYHEDNPFLSEPRAVVTSKASPLPLN